MAIRKVCEVSGCNGCPLSKKNPNNTFVAPLVGSSLVMAIGAAPEKEDSLYGEPFKGGYGKMFDAMLKKAGFHRDDVTLANVIQCRPEDDMFPTDDWTVDGDKIVQHCYAHHLKPLLESRPWERVILLGEEALNFVANKKGIGTWRGSPLPIPDLDPDEPVAIPTFPPQLLVKDKTMYPVVVNDLAKSLKTPQEDYNLFPSVEDVKKFTATEFAFDIENNRNPNPDGRHEIYMVGLSASPESAIVVPFTGAYVDELKRIFGNAKAVIGQNIIQHDLAHLKDWGVEIPGIRDCMIWDIMLLQHLRFPDLPHDLEFIASQFTSKPAWKADKTSFELYNARDVDVTMQIFKPLLEEVKRANLLNVYKKVQIPLAKICLEMTETGIKADTARLAKVQADLMTEIEELEKKLPVHLKSYTVPKRKRIEAPEGYTDPVTGRARKYLYEEVGELIRPWRSDRVKKNLLYEEWKLPEQLNPKNGKITADKVALDKLYRRLKAPTSEIYNPERADIVYAIKHLNKKAHMLSSFVKEERKAATRIHPEFNVHGTSSGRLSSSGGEAGNFQNQPPSARYLYVPSEPDWEIAECDYSNIENRLTAFCANDLKRLRNYDTPGYNDYKHAASVFFGIPAHEVEKDNDREAPYGKAKAIVLGSNYGLGAKKLADLYDMNYKEVKDLLYKWKLEIKTTVEWQNQVSKEAKRNGYLVTPFGRKRWFYTDDYHTKALSFIPQSVAADIIFRAMIGLYYERIGWPKEWAQEICPYVEPLPEPARMLLQVHDALVVEYPQWMRKDVLECVNRVMSQPWPELRGFKIPVGIAIGPSWGEVKAFNV